MKKKRIVTVLFVFIIIVLAFVVVGNVDASSNTYDEIVPHVLGFEIPTGQYCVTDYRDGKAFTQCFCACENGCVDTVNVITERVDKTQVPTDVPDTPVPPTPEPTEKPKCNAGRGNGSEGDPDCDPGNSGKNQGGD